MFTLLYKKKIKVERPSDKKKIFSQLTIIKACSNKVGGTRPHFMLVGDIYLNSNIRTN